LIVQVTTTPITFADAGLPVAFASVQLALVGALLMLTVYVSAAVTRVSVKVKVEGSEGLALTAMVSVRAPVADVRVPPGVSCSSSWSKSPLTCPPMSYVVAHALLAVQMRFVLSAAPQSVSVAQPLVSPH
jgi:hypothetical protein